MDVQGRILIPREFRVFQKTDGKQRKVFIYYSVEEKLFYISERLEEEAFCVFIRQLDNKNRFFVPAEIKRKYGTDDIMCALKNNRIYLIH